MTLSEEDILFYALEGRLRENIIFYISSAEFKEKNDDNSYWVCITALDAKCKIPPSLNLCPKVSYSATFIMTDTIDLSPRYGACEHTVEILPSTILYESLNASQYYTKISHIQSTYRKKI